MARLIEAVASGRDAKPPERWRYTSPYRGLSAMEEKDGDYFLGASARPSRCYVIAAEFARLPVLLGNSGVGKSSLAQAGVIWGRCGRQAWPLRGTQASWDMAFSAFKSTACGWCFLTLKPGVEPDQSPGRWFS